MEMGIDVTERRKAESELEKRNAELISAGAGAGLYGSPDVSPDDS
jgi:hypothetical protein